MSASLPETLRGIVGDAHVLDDPEVLASAEHDTTGRYHGHASLLVRPADTAEVAAVLKACDAAGAKVVPQGGNTGLVGGAIPHDEIVLWLGRLAALGPVDAVAGRVVVGAGATLEAVRAHVAAAGLELPIDLPARGTATIGGMVSTNAGGAIALRHGTMRARVAGLEAVLANGAVLSRLAGLLKDNAGYDLPSLLIGSEGTLAVVTAVNLRLVPRGGARVTVLIGLPDMERALDVLMALRRDVPSLTALDFFDQDGLELVLEHRKLPPPFPERHSIYLVVDCVGDGDLIEQLAGVDLGDHVAVADDTRGQEALWAYREFQNEAVAAAGVPHKADVSVAVPNLPAFTRRVRSVVGGHAKTVLYGHLGDGNVHVNVLGPEPGDERVTEAVFGLVQEFGGSISAEHGIGLAKTKYLHLSRSPEEIAAMRAIKAALDPNGTLNPGRIFAAP
jgi:FAD/FMN-containing dehydrogenase